MLITGIHMGFSANRDQPIEMMNIYMNKHAKQSGQDLLAGRHKVLGKRYIYYGREKERER